MVRQNIVVYARMSYAALAECHSQPKIRLPRGVLCSLKVMVRVRFRIRVRIRIRVGRCNTGRRLDRIWDR